MNETCNHECSHCVLDCEEREKIDLRAVPHELPHIKKVIGVASGKGGVRGMEENSKGEK